MYETQTNSTGDDIMYGTIRRNVEVNRDQLLNTLYENRQNHINIYNKTVEGYIEDATAKLDEEYEKAKIKLEETYKRTKFELENFDPEEAKDTIVFCEPISFTLTAPKTYERDYNQAISMLEWENREDVELTADEFRYFVMDEWDWSQAFTVTSGCYIK